MKKLHRITILLLSINVNVLDVVNFGILLFMFDASQMCVHVNVQIRNVLHRK